MNATTTAAPVKDALAPQSPISEAASENRKRGRPKAFSDLYVDTLAAAAGLHHCTRRAKLNFCYAIYALSRIRESGRASEFAWLHDQLKERRDPNRFWRPGLLNELGRIWFAAGENTFFEAAAALCRYKPKTKHGIHCFQVQRRRWRATA